MHPPRHPPGHPRRLALGTALTTTALALAGAPLLSAAGAPPPRSAPVAATATPEAQFAASATGWTVLVPGSPDAPGYTVSVDRSPFRVTVLRGGEPVLRTAAGTTPAIALEDSSGTADSTVVTRATWRNQTLRLRVATDRADRSMVIRLSPGGDRYALSVTPKGGSGTASVTTNYDLAASGHWYGHGETVTDRQGPYRDQPWPLDDQSDSGTVTDTAFGPASYEMVEPFWFTEKGSGVRVATTHVMTASIGGEHQGVGTFTVHDTDRVRQTVFVERTARDVYQDYVGITGAPQKSDAPDYQYRTPVWNSWAQFYTDVTQAGFLGWAKGVHDAGIPAHTFNLDDGWMSHYGDFTFNDKFPDPKAMSDTIHGLGARFGLWVTLWINLDADNYQVAKEHGYLLKSATDPSQPCTVSWWNGRAGIVDLANPAARAWYVGQLHGLQKDYGVDGFKFDTRFFDDACAPYSSDLTRADYQRLGADMADEFDLQGMGIRVHWTGSQRHGFVMRQVDKGTDWGSLNAAVAQNLALSTVGYPFVTTDMIGGSLGDPPPTKDVLVRWAQAAAAMPLMYSSTSPLGVSNFAGSRAYDAQTVRLYRSAVAMHEALAPYILDQVHRATTTGEPIMKPLFFDFPGDRTSYDIDDEWLLGDGLLVAPLLADGTRRDVHLPAGKWYDVLRRRVVRGPVDVTGYRAGLDQVPMFVRYGTGDTSRLRKALKIDPAH